MQKAARFLFLAGGLALSVYLVSQHAGAIGQALGRVGIGFLLYLLASSLIYLCDAVGWHYSFMPGQPRLPFWRLFSIRMAGEALNKVTPLASLGGEPLKALLLTRWGCTLGDAAASVAISKNCITLAQIGFIFLAVLLGLPMLPDKATLLGGFALFPGLILIAIVVTAILDISLRRRKSGADASEPEAARKSLKQNVIEMWSRCADFYWENPKSSALAFLWFFAGWAVGGLEIWVGAHLLGLEISPLQALVMEGLLTSINMATFFMPANAGAQEGGLAFLAPLFGLTTADGVALAVLRRCRDLVWIGYGLVYLFFTEGRILVKPDLRPVEAVV